MSFGEDYVSIKSYAVHTYGLQHIKEEEVGSLPLSLEHSHEHLYGVVDLSRKNQKKPERKFFDDKCFSRATLESHERARTEENLFVCDFCPKKLSNAKYLEAHRKIHMGDRPFKCDECFRAFTTNSALVHHKRSHASQYKCDVCLKQFSSTENLEVHKKIHTGERPYKCDQCIKSFTNSLTLFRHKKSHCEKHECDLCSKQVSSASELKAHKRIHEENKLFKCDQCSECFQNCDLLAQHKLEDLGECESDGISVTTSASLSEESHVEDNSVSCEDSSENSVSLGSLPEHKQNTVKEESFISEKSFSFPSQLAVDTGENHYKCKKCLKTFCTISNLFRHEASHSVDKPFVCKTCGKVFKLAGSLSKHKQTHTGIKLFECTDCPKSFFHHCDLVVHMRAHTGEKPYKCGICGSNFVSGSRLNRHIKVHKENRHEKVQKEKRPKLYKCDECQHLFRSPSELADHKRTHTGEKPFQCDMCGKRYGALRSLQKHKKTHPPDWNLCDCEGSDFGVGPKCSRCQKVKLPARNVLQESAITSPSSPSIDQPMKHLDGEGVDFCLKIEVEDAEENVECQNFEFVSAPGGLVSVKEENLHGVL